MAKRRLLATLVESAAGTQQDLSDALDISYATLHAWRTGRREVPDEALEGMGRLAMRRGRVLMETGSRLLRLAGSDERTGPRERDEPRPSAEIRTSARAMRQRSAETTERVRESLELTRDVPPR